MNEILNRYISELKNKILLKRINNKTEKQILFQTFKYFDKNTNGYCNFEDFIKVNEKIGVILSNPQELKKIFFYFDTNNEGVINYKDFINELFKSTAHNNSNKNNNINENEDEDSNDFSNNKNYSQTNYFSSYNNNDKKENVIFKQNNNINKNHDKIPPYKKPFFDKILNNLLKSEIGPSVSLLILHQGFILGDNNIMNQITIEEFIKIINDNHINLSISDIQMLFHSYELNNDGFFYYEEMFEDLINIYWNNQRKRISQRKSEEIINQLSKKGGLKINSLQNLIFVSKKYDNYFYNQLNICDANEYYNELMKKYIGLKRILNCPRDAFLTLDDLEEIMKYISFGIQNNVDFNKTINYIFKFDNNDKKEMSKNFIEDPSDYSFPTNSQISKNNKNINKVKNQNNISNNKNKNTNYNKSKSKTQSLDYYYIFREHFINYGIITLLNILKTFQYYDNGTKNINKNDFIKIMKDFQINISANIIEQLYSNFNNNQNQDTSLNYIIFISQLIDTFAHKNIINLINDIYDDINVYCMNCSGKTMNLDFFKKFFNIHDNYFFNESNEVLNNILIVYERFHYDFYEKYMDEINNKNKKDIYKLLNENIIQIEKNEFIWFYKFLNLFLENEIIFKKVILNDWKNVLSSNNIKPNNKFFANNNKNNNINNNIKNINNINYIINNTINNLNEKFNNNISNNNNNNINNKKIIKQTPILMNKNSENINAIEENNISLNNQNKSLKNNTISNDIQNNISNENHYEEQEKKEIDENNINNSQEPNNEISNTNINSDEIINIKEEKLVTNEPLAKIITKLKKRGIRGVMNLHKQFILTCKDLSSIPYEEFLNVMSLQRLSLSNDEYKNLFLSFADDDNKNNLNFPNFIRAFKKVLNDKRLSAIENAFTKLDKNGNDCVPIDDIKMKYNAKENDSVIKGEKDEEEILCEFLDCFDLNYNLLISKENQEDNDNTVNFEEFANFYEYVSFLYDKDDDFIQLINNSWKIN